MKHGWKKHNNNNMFFTLRHVDDKARSRFTRRDHVVVPMRLSAEFTRRFAHDKNVVRTIIL